MSKIRGKIDSYSRLKKSMKVTFVIDEKDCLGVAGQLDLFVKKPITLEILTDTARQAEELVRISPDQRAKVFALIKDIAAYSGEGKEVMREQLTGMFCDEKQIEIFSLSDCMTDTAGEFINWLIEFCFENGVDIKENPASGLDDIEGYIHACAKYKKCMVCGKDGLSYRIKEGISYCLCDVHYAEAKKSLDGFNTKYHFPKID